MKEQRNGLLLVVSGPSGVGKGTLVKALMERNIRIKMSVSATTRAPRPGEIDGVHYFFKSEEEFKAMRHKEGERLKLDLSARMDTMTGYAAAIEQRAPAVAEEYRAKLTARIEEMLGETEVDRARLATEVAIFADRAAIDEEIVRLNTHLIHFRELLEADEPVGRKMDFLVQEMNRECNTIGSKANDAELTSIVLLSKAEIEKLREQIQNIE